MARLGGNRRTGTDQPVSYGAAQSAATAAPPPPGFADRVLITLTGVRQPIVAILLLISFFTVISGKPVDGLLLFTVATALAWDAGTHSRLVSGAAGTGAAGTGAAGTGAAGAWAAGAGAGLAEKEPAQASVWKLRTRLPRLRFVAIGSGAAVIYALTVGSFTRYSWPTTAGVVGLGASVVIIGWGGPTRQRVIPAKFTKAGVITWSTFLVAAGLWELAALLQQPNIETSSYAHPTISTLTDPLLATAPGRTVALLGWIALGAYLVER
jgi:hypothetical protein